MSTTALIMSIPYVPLLGMCVVAMVRYRGLPKAHQALAWYVFLTTIVQFTSLFFWFREYNNMPLSHAYTAVGFFGIVWFYREVLQQYIDQRILWWTAGLFSAFAILNAIFWQDLLTFNSYALTAQCVLVIILSMATHIVLLNDSVKQEKREQVRSLRWINNGFFIFHTGTILLFYFGKIIIDSFSVSGSLYSWIPHSFFATVLYICFLVALWTQPKN